MLETIDTTWLAAQVKETYATAKSTELLLLRRNDPNPANITHLDPFGITVGRTHNLRIRKRVSGFTLSPCPVCRYARDTFCTRDGTTG